MRTAHALSRLSYTALAVAALSTGCMINPVTGEHEFVLVSEKKESEIGEKAAREVADTVGMIEDPELAAYVDTIGQRLARHAPNRNVDYRFFVVDMEEPNAFALPGGYVYVTRGLLAISNSEDELAGVIGHEIAHVAARHYAQRDIAVKSAQVLSILALVVMAAGGARPIVGPSDNVGGAGFYAAFSAYSRSQENEADEVGQELAARAGMDPEGLAEFLRALGNTVRLRFGAARYPGWFDTHPTTPDRVANTSARAQMLRWKRRARIAKTRAEYLQRLDGMILGENPAEGVFRGSRFLHPDLDLTVRFPNGWTAQNAKRAVGAMSPKRDAYLVLEIQEEGEDPEAAARTFMEKEDIEASQIAAFEIAGMPAFRAVGVAETEEGVRDVDLTWVAYAGRIYRFTGVSPTSRIRGYQGIFRQVARSMRPLREEERASIREKRLRIARAREGESLAELSERVKNAWSLQQTAVANGLNIDSRLEEGQLLKIAVENVYQPAPPPETESAAP